MDIHLPGYTLRPVTRDSLDLARVLAVYRQCEDFLSLGPVPTASMDMVLADLDLSVSEGGVFYAIEDSAGGEMVGVVDFVLAGFEGDPQLAFLSLLMIAAPHRGRGLGEAVARAVEDAIRLDGHATAIRSGVQVNNPGGIRFWQRMGYRIISGPESMEDGTVAFQLWKDL
jgi:ribosomal protein S18 acetylase RimI-like enzyme